MRKYLLSLLCVLLTIAAAITGTHLVDGTRPASTPTSSDTRPASPAPADVPAASGYADELTHAAGELADENLRTEDLPGVPERVEDASERANDQAVDDLTYPTDGILRGAAPEPTRGKCPSPNNSSRNGTKPLLGVVHDTESPNRPGTSDVEGVGAYLARPETRASATWIVDNEGNSCQGVDPDRKPWTQVWWNQWSLSTEFIGYADPAKAQWTDAQLREGARLFVRAFRQYGIPIQRAQVDLQTGRILRAGVITHKELGQRGGSHVDPGPAFPMARFLELMRHYDQAIYGAGQKRRRAAKVACRKLNWHRARAAEAGYWSKRRGHRARELKQTIARGHLACPPRA